jgi:hypothetical protein
MAKMFALNAVVLQWEFPEGVDPESPAFSYMSDGAKVEATADWVRATQQAFEVRLGGEQALPEPLVE